MKLWAGIVGVAGIAAGFLAPPKPYAVWTVVVGGGLDGYLSPCGCTYPMSGGIRRWNTGVKAIAKSDHRIILENGGFVSGTGLQDRYKAEALAESLAAIDVTAVNLTGAEANLGTGEVNQLSQLLNGKLVATSLKAAQSIGAMKFVRKGPFLIGGVTMHPASLSSLSADIVSTQTSAERLVSDAGAAGLIPILMLDGTQEDADEMAKSVPKLRLIVFSQLGDPLLAPVAVGKTLLVTPGEKGKFLVKIDYSNGSFGGYLSENLGPAVKDDEFASKVYASYLRSVERSNLIDQWPRKNTEAYVGSEKCGSCHQASYDVWRRSKHSGAYKTLETQGHGKDPDCVVCHVTALGSSEGFQTAVKTPGLAAVGCESCHGPGDRHSASPTTVHMAKIGEKSCSSCHVPDNSPRFEFLTYWTQIRHQ